MKPLSFVLAVLAGGCAATPTSAPVRNAPPGTAAPHGEEASARCPAATDPAPDAEILALAQEVLEGCRFSDGRFAAFCSAHEEWSGPRLRHRFESSAGNATLLSMLEDDNVRIRAVALSRNFVGAPAFFEDEGRARRLLAVVTREREPNLLDKLGKLAAAIDPERLSREEREALLHHPSSNFRAAYAGQVYRQHPTSRSLELLKELVEDHDQKVADEAVSTARYHYEDDRLCAFVAAELDQDGERAATALRVMGESNCKKLHGVYVSKLEEAAKTFVLAETEGKPYDDRVWRSLDWPLRRFCSTHTGDVELKRRVFDVAQAVTPLLGGWGRKDWVEVYRQCDPERARDVLSALTSDPDEDVAEVAKKELAKLTSPDEPAKDW